MSETPNERSACGFCHGEPVQNAASWTDGKPRPPAACPRCGVVAEPDDPLPADLRRVLEDPGIVIRQDAAVFELIGRWQQAKAATESAEPDGSERA